MVKNHSAEAVVRTMAHQQAKTKLRWMEGERLSYILRE